LSSSRPAPSRRGSSERRPPTVRGSRPSPKSCASSAAVGRVAGGGCGAGCSERRTQSLIMRALVRLAAWWDCGRFGSWLSLAAALLRSIAPLHVRGKRQSKWLCREREPACTRDRCFTPRCSSPSHKKFTPRLFTEVSLHRPTLTPSHTSPTQADRFCWPDACTA
jgi:hypothetical protein